MSWPRSGRGRRVSVCAFAGILALAAPAPAFAMKASLVGGVDFAKLNDDASSYRRKFGYGGGLLVDRVLTPFKTIRTYSYHFFMLEGGALYLQRQFKSGAHGYTASALQLPLLFRILFTRVLSIGAGGYLGIPLGDVQDTTGGVTAAIAHSPSVDYGTVFSLRLSTKSKKFRWFVDWRYSYGVVRYGTLGSAFYDDLIVLLGVRLGMTPFEHHFQP